MLTSIAVRVPSRVLIQALVLVTVMSLLNPLVFRHYGIPLSWRLQAAFAAVNFAVLVPLLWLRNWLDRKREAWDRSTARRFKIFMWVLALIFVALAIFVFFSR
jgi:hypothetical protein